MHLIYPYPCRGRIFIRIFGYLHLILFVVWPIDAFQQNISLEYRKLSENALHDMMPIDVPDTHCNNRPKNGVDRWHCKGDKLLTVPNNLNISSKPLCLTLIDAGIEVLTKQSLRSYTDYLSDLNLEHLLKFHTFEPGVFYNATKLRSIYVVEAPSLTHINPEVFNVHLPSLQFLKMTHTGLLTTPYLGNLVTGILNTVDFENNPIHTIGLSFIKITVGQLSLNFNKITEIGSMAFNGSSIANLSFKGNTALTKIYADAFVGLQDLQKLDLSHTSITTLPTIGLETLEILRIENTRTLTKFPFVYNFKSITEAILTYPYHCCAFKFPAEHDPEMYQKQKELENENKKNCSPRKRHTSNSSETSNEIDSTNMFGTHLEPILNPSIISDLNLCDWVAKDYQNVTCDPMPGPFNPCEDIMGNWKLRILVWLVVILAMAGNSAVLIVLVFSPFEFTVPKFLICNLAFADLCMGIYLALIASMDIQTIGVYFNYAITWQNGPGCQIAGFLTVFSTELSIYALTVITCERWYTITYAIYPNRRLKMKTAVAVMTIGWLYACIMAALPLPLVGVSGYAKTSMCLPMKDENVADFAYLVSLLIFNILAFCVIVSCYGHMYASVHGAKDLTPMTHSDMTIAKRMALLIFTDFACWSPIAFFAITALAGRPLINVTDTKILLVVFYPLNSCANPYIYALLTHQYRRDIFTLLARHGICEATAAKYKGTDYPVTARRPKNDCQESRVTLGELNESSNPTNQTYCTSALTMVMSTDLKNTPNVSEQTPKNNSPKINSHNCQKTAPINATSQEAQVGSVSTKNADDGDCITRPSDSIELESKHE